MDVSKGLMMKTRQKLSYSGFKSFSQDFFGKSKPVSEIEKKGEFNVFLVSVSQGAECLFHINMKPKQ